MLRNAVGVGGVSFPGKKHFEDVRFNVITISALRGGGWGQNFQEKNVMQSITFEASDRSRSLPLALIHVLASELSLAPIREIARYKKMSI